MGFLPGQGQPALLPEAGRRAESPLGWDRDLPWKYGLQTSLPLMMPTHPISTLTFLNIWSQTAAFKFIILIIGK